MIPHNIRVLKNIKPTNVVTCDDNGFLQIMTNTKDINNIDFDKVNRAILKSFGHMVLIGEMYRDLSSLESHMSSLLLLIRNYYLLKFSQNQIDQLINIYYKVKNDIELVQTKYNIAPITILIPETVNNENKKQRFLRFFITIKEKIQKLWNMIRIKNFN